MARNEIQPYWLNNNNAAKSCGVTLKTFNQWGVAPCAIIGRSKYFLISDIIESRVDRAIQTMKKKPGMGSSEAKEAMDAAKLSEINEKTEMLALKNAVMRKESAPIAVLETALGRACSQIAATLDSIPVMVKRRCPKLNATDLAIVKEEIIKCQNIAADTTIDLNDV